MNVVGEVTVWWLPCMLFPQQGTGQARDVRTAASVHRRAVDIPSWPDPGLPAEPGRARRGFRAGMLDPLILLQVDYQRLLERAMAAAAVTAGRGQVADCR